jgi:uncharacterized membrane protein YeaQ/YmgE (transglycosylase-associated protein family)
MKELAPNWFAECAGLSAKIIAIDAGITRGRKTMTMTEQGRAKLQVAAVIGAVLGGVTGYLISGLAGSGGWPKILIWALIGAVVVSGIVYCLRAFRL